MKDSVSVFCEIIFLENMMENLFLFYLKYLTHEYKIDIVLVSYYILYNASYLNSAFNQLILIVYRHRTLYSNNKNISMKYHYKWLMIYQRFNEIFQGLTIYLNISVHHFDFSPIVISVNNYIIFGFLNMLK